MNGEERALSAAPARAAAPGQREPSALALLTPGPSHTLGSSGGNALTHYLTSGSSVKLSLPWCPQCKSGSTHVTGFVRTKQRRRTLNTWPVRSQHLAKARRPAAAGCAHPVRRSQHARKQDGAQSSEPKACERPSRPIRSPGRERILHARWPSGRSRERGRQEAGAEAAGRQRWDTPLNELRPHPREPRGRPKMTSSW